MDAETDTKDIINQKDDNNLDHQKYRNVVRSKILRRIQEKSELFDNFTEDVGLQQQESDIGIDSRQSNNDPNIDDNLVDDSKINEKVRRQLSNEWRKTLERVLNYRQDYLDDKLEVKRKDSIRFFIESDWPDETSAADTSDSNEDDDDDSGRGSNKQRRRRRRRKRKHKKNRDTIKDRNRAICPPEYDPEKILVVRMKRSRSEPEQGIERILTEGFEIELEMEYDEDFIEELQQFFHHRILVRLLREGINLKSFPVDRFVRNYQERFLVQDPVPLVSWNQDLILNHYDLMNKSKFLKIFIKTLQIFVAPGRTMAEDHPLNNRSLMLSIGTIRLDFHKHPKMEREDRMIKKLTTAYQQYRKSISAQNESKLKTVQQQIDLLVAKLDVKSNQNDGEEHAKELEMDLKLLQRLTLQYDQLILAKRKSLIKLIEQWSRFQNDLEKYPKHSELNQIDLRLDETNDQNALEQEQFQLEQLLEWRLKIETILNDHGSIRSNQIKESVFLMDGRLPGEPKFKDIELIMPRNLSNHNENLLNIQYYIEVLIGNKIVATFEHRPLLRRSFEIMWDNHRSFPMPIILGNQTYRFATATTTTNNGDVDVVDDEDYHRRLPRIRIQERNSTMKTVKTIAEIGIQGLPLPVMDYKERSMRIVERFNYTDDDDDDDRASESNFKTRKSILEATTEFRAFWQSLPINDQTLSDRFWLYDETKRKIKQTKDLDKIDQWLHDLRYQIMDDLDPLGTNFVEGMSTFPLVLHHHHWYQRRLMELMQLLLKQKYQIELMRIFEAKKQQLANRKLDNQQPDSLEIQDDGTFCTDEEINSNKRFQMMIQRNQGHPGYRDYRFMPLTTMDLFLIPDSLTNLAANLDLGRTSMAQVLWEFLRKTCQKQQERLNDQTVVDDQASPISHDWCDTENQWFQCAQQVLQQIWSKSIPSKTDELHREDQQPLTMVDDSGIVSYQEIVREPSPFDAVQGFSWLNSLVWFNQTPSALVQLANQRHRLNPPRKNRQSDAIQIQDALQRDVQVHLLVQQASNVPLKTNDNNKQDVAKRSVPSPCASYVEIKIDSSENGNPNRLQTMSTSVSVGDQPSWNESFKFKTKIDLKKKILLNLFVVNKSKNSAIKDQQDDDEDDDGHFVDDPAHNHDHSKLERLWLGQLKISLKTLLFQPKIEGSFRLFSPYFLQSFRNLNKSLEDDRKEEGKLSKSVDKLLSLNSADLDPLTDVRLSVFITTDPLIETNNLAPNSNPNSLEPIELIDYCDRWLQALNKRFPQRRYLCMVDNVQHRSILVTRFLSPLKPPDFDQLSPLKLEDLKPSKSKKSQKMTRLSHQERLYVQLIIRFVSLIPSLLDQTAGNHQQQQSSSRFIEQWSRKQIWLDVVQFLTLRLGGQAEHAILLCCFLQYLDKKAYLVLGTGQLDGPTVYVIVYPGSEDQQQDQQEETEVADGRNAKFRLIFIDAKRGQQFSVQDFNCTLITVDSIITPDNVYANVQKSNHPSLISYNLKRANYWQPLFTYRTRMNFTNLDLVIQPAALEYGVVNQDRAKNMELKLETYLREQFMNWRRQQTGTYTAFNRFCGQIIKRILPELERHSCLLGQRFFREKRTQIEERIGKELNEIYDLHKIISYPLNILAGPTGYCAWNLEQLSRLIYSTQLHQTHFGSPNQVEYVLVCHIHQYPCDLYSIWIWLSALTSKSVVSSS